MGQGNLRSFEEKAALYIRKMHMIPAGSCLSVALSGGADSVALLLALQALSKSLNFELCAVHVEHGIRGQESLRDAAFVEQLCKSRGIPLEVYHVDAPARAAADGLSLEEAARLLRYECLEKSADCIALAHHMEDNVETMLFQMARGSGLKGMSGMPPVRTGSSGCRFIRPLLEHSRVEIEAYLQEQEQNYCTDSTNADPSYSRNRIRSRILPELAAVNEQAMLHFSREAEELRETEEYLKGQTESIWEGFIREGSLIIRQSQKTTGQEAEMQKLFMRKSQAQDARSRDLSEYQFQAEEPAPGEFTTKEPAIEESAIEELAFKVSDMLDQPSLMQKRLLRKALILAAGRQKDITAAHVEALVGLLEKQSGKVRKFPYDLCAKREFEWLLIRKQQTPERVIEKSDWKKSNPAQKEIAADMHDRTQLRETDISLNPCLLSEKETRVETGKGDLGLMVLPAYAFSREIPQKTYTKWLDYDKINKGLCIRTRQQGDYLIIDEAGHRKKLQNYLTDLKIPAAERDKVLLVASGPEILWVVGGRISASCKVTPETRRILKIQFYGGQEDGLYKEL